MAYENEEFAYTVYKSRGADEALLPLLAVLANKGIITPSDLDAMAHLKAVNAAETIEGDVTSGDTQETGADAGTTADATNDSQPNDTGATTTSDAGATSAVDAGTTTVDGQPGATSATVPPDDNNPVQSV